MRCKRCGGRMVIGYDGLECLSCGYHMDYDYPTRELERQYQSELLMKLMMNGHHVQQLKINNGTGLKWLEK